MIDFRRWPEADRLLDRALDLPSAERRALLDREAGHDPELHAALSQVLAETDRADGFLDRRGEGVEAIVADALGVTEADREPALRPGTRFTSYEVEALVGRGGMGEVYRARDERLGRLVALKVLPDAFVEDRQRLARFDREARLLASLNHPNIAAIYELAEDGGRRAIVQEFVGGSTLATRLAAGPVPSDEALGIARQLALALETAHRRGIVHRDLKPGNIALLPDGAVKVLDFGLAKAIEHEEPAGAGLTSLHEPRRVVGTPAYMSPEQARGDTVDQRTDIWSFGCVLYEMLAGERAFPGEATPEVLARVLEREPDFARLPPATPEPIRRLLRRALAKDPQKRLAHLGDALLEIDDAERHAHGWRFHLPIGGRRARTIGAVIGLGILVVAGVVAWRALRSEPPRAVVRLAIPVPPSDELIASGQQVAAIAPDGRTVVYRANRGGVVRLFRRALGGMHSEPVPGTENAAGPFFSPDGAWLGFDGDGVLQKISLAGGSPVTIAPAPGGANASWGGDTIVFATATARVLHRVPASGGMPEALTSLDLAAGDLAHAFPHVLPSGDAVLYTIVRATDSRIAAMRLATREVRLLTAGTQPRYLPSGHVLFARDDTLWAAPFDARRLELAGEPVPVLEALDTAGGAAAHFSVSADGALLYAPRREEIRERRIVWLDRQGVETDAGFAPGRFTRAALSPDGRRIAFALTEGNNTDIWIGEPERGTRTRLTREPGTDTAPLWTPDGLAVVFRSERGGGGLFRQDVDGVAPSTRLTSSGERLHTPHGWGGDARTLLFTEFRSYSQQGIYSLPPGAASPQPLLTAPFAQLRPQVSPDGRWLAYQSDESGRYEIYVRPGSASHAARWQVSPAGGTSPRWSHDGRELFYYDGHAFVAVPIAAGAAFTPGRQLRLFAYSPFGGRLGPDFDVSPDNRRFLMIRSSLDTPASRLQLVLVQNWTDELRTRISQ